MPFGKRIQLFLLDGSPNGRWICELSNWTGIAYKIPRTHVRESESRKELSSPGIYFLFGKDDSDLHPMVYIGEAENIIHRLKQHLEEKDFWNEVIVFQSKGTSLNKAHIKYLENQFYALAVAAKRYALQNANTPTRSSISEAEEAELEEFVHNALILINTLGHKVFEPISEVQDCGDSASTDVIYHLTVSGLHARGIQTSDGFVVLKGSTTHRNNVRKSLSSGIAKRIETCRTNGQVVDYIVQEDLLFSSSSGAASFIAGYPISGPQAWKTEDGRSLKEIEGQ